MDQLPLQFEFVLQYPEVGFAADQGTASQVDDVLFGGRRPTSVNKERTEHRIFEHLEVRIAAQFDSGYATVDGERLDIEALRRQLIALQVDGQVLVGWLLEVESV